MDKVIVTGLLVTGAVAAAVIVIITIGPSIGTSSQSVVQSQSEAAKRIKTAIEIIAVAANSDGTTVDAYVKNVGVATIDALDNSDVFLILEGTRFDAMSYSTGGATLTWSGDLKESGIAWNRGDTLHVEVSLSGADVVADNLTHVLRFSTPNGVTDEESFSR